jgi:hypothetical protein
MTDAPDLVGVVQGFGLFSAAAVVDRYAEIVDRAISRHAPSPAAQDGGAGRLADAWLRLLDTTSTLLRSGAAQNPADGALVLPPTTAGRSCDAALWLHNTTSSPVPAVALHVTGLVSTDGHRIPAEAVTLVPERIDLLAAGTSREVRLRLRVPAGQDAATYHGLVVTSAAPTEPLAVRLEVRAPEGAGP